MGREEGPEAEGGDHERPPRDDRLDGPPGLHPALLRLECVGSGILNVVIQAVSRTSRSAFPQGAERFAAKRGTPPARVCSEACAHLVGSLSARECEVCAPLECNS